MVIIYRETFEKYHLLVIPACAGMTKLLFFAVVQSSPVEIANQIILELEHTPLNIFLKDLVK